MSSLEATLEIGDEVVDAPTAEDIDRGLQRQPRDDDWAMTLTRANDDYMDACVLAGGAFQVVCAEGGRTLRSASAVDDATLKSLFLSFLAGDDSWSRQCTWVVPPPTARTEPPKALIGVAIAIFVLVAGLAGSHNGQWILVLFALAFPGVIAGAMVMKMREAKRAASWTQATARILKSELATVERPGPNKTTRKVQLPQVEYEFAKGFDKFVGDRISIGEIAPGSVEVQQALERYRVGASVPVFYNPANPQESVLERDLPKYFAVAWVFVAVLAVVLVGGALWGIGVIS